MKVREWIENRPRDLYGRGIRILNLTSNKNMGDWTDYQDRYVLRVKIKTKYIFLYI